MKRKCTNFAVCGNYVTHGDTCPDCQRALQHLTQEDTRRTLDRQEQKPRDWRDAWGVGRAK